MQDETLATLPQRFQPYYDDMIAFAQKLVQTPSYAGEEAAVAALVKAEMIKLHYDEVWSDRAGSIVGLIRGGTSRQAMMINAHMDHVSVGDENDWPYPPFSGTIADDSLWGRGTVDLKGSVATMVYAAGALRREGVLPPWDVYVAAVVFEETGGVGTQVVLERVHPEFCVIGEATGNELALGHRGVVGMDVEIRGKAAHASMVDVGVNPHYTAARFILGLRHLKHDVDPMLGASTVAPTLYTTDQTSSNVIPGAVRMYLDWRSVPQETPEAILAQVQTLLQASLEPGTSGSVRPRQFENRTYTGLQFITPIGKAAVKTDPSGTLAKRSLRALRIALGREVKQIVWRFCTDGTICAEAGVPIVGFGPGDETLAHTSSEHVGLADLREAMVGHGALALSPGLVVAPS